MILVPNILGSFFLINVVAAIFIPPFSPGLNDYFQFNFKFNLSEDMYAEDSVELLQNSGIQFDRHEREVTLTCDIPSSK